MVVAGAGSISKRTRGPVIWLERNDRWGIWRQVNATDASRRSAYEGHIFFLFFSRLSRQKAYTDILESSPVACETGITNGTTVKGPNAVHFRFDNTVKRAGRAGRWRGLVGAVWSIPGRTASESSERGIFA